jgi:hypothetical protein
MISSWKEFFAVVEKMRECQKEYAKTRALSARLIAKKCEDAVDACIKEKRAEWAREKQPELIGDKQ